MTEIAAVHRRCSAIGQRLIGAITRGAGSQPYLLRFMAPPAFLEGGDVTPFTDPALVGTDGGDPRILYATLREPVESATREPFYSLRAGDLRVGVARIGLGKSDVTWDEARRMSILKNNTDKYPLRVRGVDDFGVLDCSTRAPGAGDAPRDPHPRQRFTAIIDSRLDGRRDRDVFIYVHGYRVSFENPVLVAAELWHFLGYEGVFIAFAWPARRGRLAYFGDTESSLYAAPYLRAFLEYLARDTRTRAIHVIGYSAGTRLVAAALHELALIHQKDSVDQIHAELKLGEVILVASDVDRGIFVNYVRDGVLRVPQRLTIYESPRDKALRIVTRILGADRVGELEKIAPGAARFLRQTDRLALIDVENTQGFDTGNGHAYFRDSPLVSSDLLATLRYGLGPAERGLVRAGDSPIWTFPRDYLQKLEAAVFRADPELAQRARAVSTASTAS